MTQAATRGSVTALSCFTLVYVALEAAWWYALAPPSEDLSLLDLFAELTIFGAAVAIAAALFRARAQVLTKHDRHVLALRCVAIAWTTVVVMAGIEALVYGSAPFGDLFAEYDSWDLALMVALAAAITVLFVLFVTIVYYSVARLILHFVGLPNRIAAQ